MTVSQCDRVLDVLRDGQFHSIEEIHERAGTMRLNSRIAELRKRHGLNIICHRQDAWVSGRRVTTYFYKLVSPLRAAPAEPTSPGSPGDSSGSEQLALIDTRRQPLWS